MIDYLPIVLEVDPPRRSDSGASALLACSKTLLRAGRGGPKCQPLPCLRVSYPLGKFTDGAAVKMLEF